MSGSTTTFNGRGLPKVRRTHHITVSAAVTITTSSVAQTASISGSAFVVATSHGTSSSGTPIPSISLSSHRVNAGVAVMSSQPNPSITDRAPSSSIEKATQTSSTPAVTGVNMSIHNNIEPPEGKLNPRQMGAIIGGSVGVTAIILVAIALFFVLRRRRRRRRVIAGTTKLSSEKKAKIEKSPHISSSGPARTSRYPTRTMNVYSDIECLYHGVSLPPGFKKSHTRSFSNHFEQTNVSPNPTFAHVGSLKHHTVRHLGTPSLPGHSSRLRGEAWHPIPSQNIRDSATQNSRRVTSMDFPDPFLDPPRNSELESSLRRPATPHYAFYQSSLKISRRSMSVPSMPNNNGGIENLIPSQSSYQPLNFGFREQGAQAPVPLHLDGLPARAPFPTQRNDSMTSQMGSNSASSGSVIILPGRLSTASSGIFEASASDLSQWRRNRSPQEGGIDSRRSDPFDLERPDSYFTGDGSFFEDPDTRHPPLLLPHRGLRD
ncbi:hypothetical protein EMCG_01108 [[Emmonsia] crescens]|uniref:Uncharacterized protein n=1 Tax=[Emmonsia] crescens TaxID=73230 RepID=A0A0G2I9L9_9EURO|nr:hypothetical protein EMCG_01108 [Emmonsia crescens UAMH 3008]